MNLTADRKAKLAAICQAQKDHFKAILTPAQQAQLERGFDRHREAARHYDWNRYHHERHER